MPATRFFKAILPITLLVGLVLITGQTPAGAAFPTIRLVAPTYPLSPTGIIDVDVVVENAVWLGHFEFTLSFDPALVEVLDITSSPSFGDSDVTCNPVVERCARSLGPVIEGGTARMGGYSYGPGKGACGDSTIATIHLRPSSTGKTLLHLSDALFADILAHPARPSTMDTIIILGEGNLIYLPLVGQQTGTDTRSGS